MNQHAGAIYETHARDYLEKQGLCFVDRNFRSKMGEIDLIMRDQNDIVFVEVRYRKQNHYGSGIESIDALKQARIIKTAEIFLDKHQWTHAFPSRFDVMSMTGDLKSLKIDWIKDAF